MRVAVAKIDWDKVQPLTTRSVGAANSRHGCRMIPPTRQRRFGFGTQNFGVDHKDPSLSHEVADPRDYPMTSRRTSCFRRPRQQAVFVHEADIVRPSLTARLWTEEVYRARATHTAAGVIALERQRAPLVQCESRPAGESYEHYSLC